MQRALERALDHADLVIESAQQRPPERQSSSSGWKSLHEKLYDIYVEECGKEPEVTEELTSNVHLLEKLVQRESLPCLVVNLYPGEEGYSLMIKGENELYSETIRLPYEERDFLEYLDAEELPPILVDVLEKCQANIFQSGCVITEVRDYRLCMNMDRSGYQSRHVLLRPTMQTLASDIHSITSDNQIWTQEDRLALESQLILATAEPLCLDPSVSVACIENKLLYNKQKMNTPPMRRNFKRYSTASLNWQQEPSCSSLPSELRAWDFHKKRKERQAGQQDDLNFSKAGRCVDMWKQQPCELKVPSEVDVDKYAKEERSVTYDDAQPVVWPALEAQGDSLFGCEAGNPSQTTKPTCMQSLNDPLISGKRKSRKKARGRRQMSHRRSSTDDHPSSSRPGSQTGARKAARQSKELLQNLVAQASSGSASLSQPSSGRAAEQPQAVSIQSAALGKGGLHTPPSISLPCSSGNSSWDNSFTPQRASCFRKSPSHALASETSLPKKSSVKGNRVRRLPAATVSTASASPKTPASKVKATSARPKVTKVVSPAHAAQTALRGSTPLKGSTARAKTPVAIKPRIVCSGGQQLAHTQPALPKPPSQGIKIIFKSSPVLTPIALVQFPGSVIVNTQQQPQQEPQQQPQQLPQHPQQQQPQHPQQQPQQQTQHPQQQLQQPHQFYQLIPQQHQQPLSHFQQPVAMGSSSKGSTHQIITIPAPQVAIINPNEVGSFLKPQMAVLSQPSSTQAIPGQSPPQQRVVFPAVIQQLPHSQPVQLRILQIPVTVPTTGVPNSSATSTSTSTATATSWPAGSKPAKR